MLSVMHMWIGCTNQTRHFRNNKKQIGDIWLVRARQQKYYIYASKSNVGKKDVMSIICRVAQKVSHYQIIKILCLILKLVYEITFLSSN